MKRYGIKPGFQQREATRKQDQAKLKQWHEEWVEGGMQMGHHVSCIMYERKYPIPVRNCRRKKRRGGVK